MNDQRLNLKGQLLLAMPGLRDPNFAQTVTCICEHTADGALGVSVNRRHAPLNGSDIFEALELDCAAESRQLPVFWGGPVHVNELFVLHGPPLEWEGSLSVVPGMLALSNSLDVLAAIARGEGPQRALIALGCAGWGPGQLEGELQQNSWLTCAATVRLVFTVPVAQRWEAGMKAVGVDPALLSDAAGHA